MNKYRSSSDAWVHLLSVRTVCVVLQNKQIHHQIAAAASGRETTRLENTTWLVHLLGSAISTYILNIIDNSAELFAWRESTESQGFFPDSLYGICQYLLYKQDENTSN